MNTSLDRDRIIDKIKKCLALAKSSNEHEAAAALRQARKLMQQHGISDLFSEGWVMTATELVENFAGNEATKTRVTAYLEHRHKLTSFQGRNRNAGRSLSERDYGDMNAGHRAGRAAQLNRGVGSADAPLALEA